MTLKRSDISDVDVCNAAKTRADIGYPGPFVDEILAAQFPLYPEKVIWAAMERAEDRGLLDCGTSLRGAWLTEKGEQLLIVGATKTC